MVSHSVTHVHTHTQRAHAHTRVHPCIKVCITHIHKAFIVHRYVHTHTHQSLHNIHTCMPKSKQNKKECVETRVQNLGRVIFHEATGSHQRQFPPTCTSEPRDALTLDTAAHPMLQSQSRSPSCLLLPTSVTLPSQTVGVLGGAARPSGWGWNRPSISCSRNGRKDGDFANAQPKIHFCKREKICYQNETPSLSVEDWKRGKKYPHVSMTCCKVLMVYKSEHLNPLLKSPICLPKSL